MAEVSPSTSPTASFLAQKHNQSIFSSITHNPDMCEPGGMARRTEKHRLLVYEYATVTVDQASSPIP